jgi:hypothetical protein
VSQVGQLLRLRVSRQHIGPKNPQKYSRSPNYGVQIKKNVVVDKFSVSLGQPIGSMQEFGGEGGVKSSALFSRETFRKGYIQMPGPH